MPITQPVLCFHLAHQKTINHKQVVDTYVQDIDRNIALYKIQEDKLKMGTLFLMASGRSIAGWTLELSFKALSLQCSHYMLETQEYTQKIHTNISTADPNVLTHVPPVLVSSLLLIISLWLTNACQLMSKSSDGTQCELPEIQTCQTQREQFVKKEFSEMLQSTAERRIKQKMRQEVCLFVFVFVLVYVCVSLDCTPCMCWAGRVARLS